jgi:hypothetical protein
MAFSNTSALRSELHNHPLQRTCQKRRAAERARLGCWTVICGVRVQFTGSTSIVNNDGC